MHETAQNNDPASRALAEAHVSGDRAGLTEIAVMLDGPLPPADVSEGEEVRELATE